MYKLGLVLGTALMGTAILNAGQIQIGGANGLTATYLAAGGSTTGWGERNYVASLFENATVTPTAGQTNSLPPQVGVPGVNTAVDANGIVFSMLNDGMVSGLANDVWSSNTAGAVSITVPINVSAVQNVYVMLNDFWGYAGENATISFNFASGADVITLTNLANGAGAIRSAVDCTASTGTIACPGPATIGGGHTVSASLPSTSNTNVSGNATIRTSSIWSADYSMPVAAVNNVFNNATSSSTGKLTLDELAFSFSTNYGGTTLNSITITTDANNANGVSKLALSAITVVTTPEPASFALFATGLGLLGFGGLRRRKQ